jgi:hypothetical protein
LGPTPPNTGPALRHKTLYHITELCVFIKPYVKFENKFLRARTGPDKIMV